jgi:hypothetical protein
VTGNFALKPIPSESGIDDKFSPPSVAEDFFFSLYPNRIQAILCPVGCRNWTTISKQFPLPDETILAAIDGKKSEIYGLKFGDETRFAVLDIDKNSQYRNALELGNLQTKLAAVGLIAKPYRSSESGGWHLYIFFEEWANRDQVQRCLSDWLRAHGYEIRNGVLEVNPSGMGLRLPLQSGFAWLDNEGNLIRTREELTRDEAIASFVFDLEENKRNWSEAKNRIESELEAIDRSRDRDALAHQKAIDTDGFEKLFNYRLIAETYEEGRRIWQEGLTKTGQRHDAIKAIEHYLWHGDQIAGVPALPATENDEARYNLILRWMEERHNGFCNHINRGKWHKVKADIKRACFWRRRSEAFKVRTPYPLTERAIEVLIARSKRTRRMWTMEDLQKGNEGRLAEARRKIAEATGQLIAQGRRVTLRQLMRMTGCHYDTLNKHADIWKVSVVSISSVSGDQSPFLDLDLGVGGTAPGSEEEKKEILDPPGFEDSGDLDDSEALESVELAPIVITPPLLLPGSKPTSELPASSPSPSGCFASLDAGAQVRRYSGRGSGAAGGLEQEPNSQATGADTSVVFVILQTYRAEKKRTRAPVWRGRAPPVTQRS